MPKTDRKIPETPKCHANAQQITGITPAAPLLGGGKCEGVIHHEGQAAPKLHTVQLVQPGCQSRTHRRHPDIHHNRGNGGGHNWCRFGPKLKRQQLRGSRE